METLLIITTLSFIAGASGYILFYFILRPVVKYRMLKQRIKKTLAAHEADTPGSQQSSDLLKLASDLTTIHNQFPVWYGLLLEKNNEEPLTAASHLSTLANIKNNDHAGQRIEKIKQALRM